MPGMPCKVMAGATATATATTRSTPRCCAVQAAVVRPIERPSTRTSSPSPEAMSADVSDDAGISSAVNSSATCTSPISRPSGVAMPCSGAPSTTTLMPSDCRVCAISWNWRGPFVRPCSRTTAASVRSPVPQRALRHGSTTSRAVSPAAHSSNRSSACAWVVAGRCSASRRSSRSTGHAATATATPRGPGRGCPPLQDGRDGVPPAGRRFPVGGGGGSGGWSPPSPRVIVWHAGQGLHASHPAPASARREDLSSTYGARMLGWPGERGQRTTPPTTAQSR